MDFILEMINMMEDLRALYYYGKYGTSMKSLMDKEEQKIHSRKAWFDIEVTSLLYLKSSFGVYQVQPGL